MTYGLSQSTYQRICDVLRRHPEVEQAILYGSRARGNYRNGSDIDLTLRGGADLTLSVLYRIMDELDDLLLPYTIDLSLQAKITDAALLARIEGEGVTFCQRVPRPVTERDTEPAL